MKKTFKLLKWILLLAVVGVLMHQVITLVWPEGRKAKSDDEVYPIERREAWIPKAEIKYDKIINGPYDVQYSPEIKEPYNTMSATVMDYEAYCEMCEELEIRQTYVNSDADYIVWKNSGSPKIRWDVVNVIARDDVAMVYLKGTVNILRGKAKSGRAIIIPVEKGSIVSAGVGDAYRFEFGRPAVDKPVIYLYPEEETEVSVSLEMKDAILKCTYPEYQNGWKVIAQPDGTLYAEGREYNYLFWEAEALFPFTLKSGTCVAGKDTCKFLEEKLTQLGLSDKEQDDFITYWLPKMQDNPYNVIAFKTDEYEEHFGLEVTPKPDTIIRVFMTYKASEVYVDIEPEEITTPVRAGFTVVEWGGCEISE
ncbi:MAG: hypothetical protein J6L65_08645 [Lachnospiraceae bacterium]|nr:hypothetical protein [Lachnospiraceae bacterium]